MTFALLGNVQGSSNSIYNYGRWNVLAIASSNQRLRNSHLSFQVSKSKWISQVKIVHNKESPAKYILSHRPTHFITLVSLNQPF